MASASLYQVPRMNFLKTDKFALNYGTMGMVVLACVLIMATWFGATLLRVSLLEKGLVDQVQKIQEMNQEKDKRLSYAQLAGKKFQAKSAEREFKSIFANPPKVAEFLTEVAKQLPPQLQLLDVKLEKSVDENENEYKLTILGKGKNPRLVTNYTLRLEDSVYFKNVKLISTEHGAAEDKGSFLFHVEAFASPVF